MYENLGEIVQCECEMVTVTKVCLWILICELTFAKLTMHFHRVYTPQAAESFVGLMSKDYPTLKITYIASFSKSPAFGFDQLHSAKIKIVLAMFSEKLARRVLCQVNSIAVSIRLQAHKFGELGIEYLCPSSL